MFSVPAGYVGQLGDREAALRRAWVAGLPALAGEYARAWSLRPDGAPLHGFVAVVWPVRLADDTPAMLKLSWPDEESADEATALAAWAGRGAVALLRRSADGYALLLERLDPRRSLADAPLGEAVEVAGGLLRSLAVPAPPLRRTLAATAARWAVELPARAAALGDPIPRRLLDAALAHCRDLGPAAGSALVNEDLHYFNVLAGGREPWLVIDPKPLAGDPEFGVIPLLWNRWAGAADVPGRLDAVVAAAGLDRELARAWTVVRAVDNWLWALGGGAHPAAEACAEIAGRLA